RSHCLQSSCQTLSGRSLKDRQNFTWITSINAGSPCGILLDDRPPSTPDNSDVQNSCFEQRHSPIGKQRIEKCVKLDGFTFIGREFRRLLELCVPQINGKCPKFSVQNKAPKLLLPFDYLGNKHRQVVRQIVRQVNSTIDSRFKALIIRRFDE